MIHNSPTEAITSKENTPLIFKKPSTDTAAQFLKGLRRKPPHNYYTYQIFKDPRLPNFEVGESPGLKLVALRARGIKVASDMFRITGLMKPSVHNDIHYRYLHICSSYQCSPANKERLSFYGLPKTPSWLPKAQPCKWRCISDLVLHAPLVCVPD